MACTSALASGLEAVAVMDRIPGRVGFAGKAVCATAGGKVKAGEARIRGAVREAAGFFVRERGGGSKEKSRSRTGRAGDARRPCRIMADVPECLKLFPPRRA